MYIEQCNGCKYINDDKCTRYDVLIEIVKNCIVKEK